MAKTALEVVNGVNLFGKHGAHWSVIFVDIDAHYRNRTTVDSILARESASKVVRRHSVSIALAGGRGDCAACFTLLFAYLFCLSVTIKAVDFFVAKTYKNCGSITANSAEFAALCVFQYYFIHMHDTGEIDCLSVTNK